MPVEVAERFFIEIHPSEAQRLHEYIASANFEVIALQLTLGRALNDIAPDDLLVNVREQIRLGITKNVNLRSQLRYTGTDILYYSLLACVDENVTQLSGEPNGTILATTAQASAIAAANSRLLHKLANLAEIHEFSQKMRKQVAALHARMRTPHLGASSQPVPYHQLYVEPDLMSAEGSGVPLDRESFLLPSRRTVILGDPGAGKSTFAAKFAHDIASNHFDGTTDQVPFLLVLRNFSASMRRGNKPLLHYLEQVCRNPYNLDPPPDAIEYLLRNGRAVVILDGIDELVDPELRRNVVQLIHGFAGQHPLVPMLITARRIGYHEAPLPADLFGLGSVEELNDRQVRQYAENWFKLDAHTLDSESTPFAESFMTESKDIAELRSNPLLLALLCSMYSAEHYIPQNLAQIYERCALMLFERWDKMRGITMPLQFQGQLRGAVQYLAWRLSNSPEPDKGLPNSTVVQILAEYLLTKKFDEDEATATATQFLDFCTGRAWILTDVGATTSEARYGFAHRTFLEFFAAEHLVRTHPAAEQLWAALKPRITGGGWDIAGQIALQLLDRNVDGGVDQLLHNAISEPFETNVDAGREKLRVHSFAAGALGYVFPGRDVINTVVATAVRDALAIGPLHPFTFWVSNHRTAYAYASDVPFRTLREGCLSANQATVDKAVTQTVEGLCRSDNGLACFAIESFARAAAQNSAAALIIPSDLKRISQELLRDRPEVFREARVTAPWWNLCWDPDPVDLVRRFGPMALYLNCASQLNSTGSLASRIIEGNNSGAGPHVDNEQFCLAMTAAKLPWIVHDLWWTDFPSEVATTHAMNPSLFELRLGLSVAAGPLMLLMLPFLEARTHPHFANLSLPVLPEALEELSAARTTGVVTPHLERLLRICTLMDEVRTFVSSWARQEFSVVIPPPDGGISSGSWRLLSSASTPQGFVS
jgi:hypothetical protein